MPQADARGLSQAPKDGGRTWHRHEAQSSAEWHRWGVTSALPLSYGALKGKDCLARDRQRAVNLLRHATLLAWGRCWHRSCAMPMPGNSDESRDGMAMASYSLRRWRMGLCPVLTRRCPSMKGLQPYSGAMVQAMLDRWAQGACTCYIGSPSPCAVCMAYQASQVLRSTERRSINRPMTQGKGEAQVN